MSGSKRTTRFCRSLLIVCILGLQQCCSEETGDKGNTLVDKDEGLSVIGDSEILEAPSSRSARHLAVLRGWAEVLPLGGGGPCLTGKGTIGACTSFRQCYPYFKLPDLGLWESWVLGNYDTCSYFNKDGRQAYGVCCTNPAQFIPANDGSNNTIISSLDVGSVSDTFESPAAQPNESPSVFYPNWPPPIPTHPPDHTAPTHPPSIHFPPKPPTHKPPTTKPSKQEVAITTTTKRPTTTWPTRPPAQKPPSYPQWPPPIPTHPPSYPTRPPIYQTTTVATTARPTAEPHPPSSDVACGAKNGYQDQERIVGGHNADPNEWPWIAALFNGGRQFCGGSLIDNQHILTAAHCVAHMSSWDVARITVRLGDHNIRSDHEVKHVERRVKRVVRHRGFDSRTLYNDVAVLKMDSPVQFTRQVRPVCLPSSAGSRGYAGQTGTVIGWGSLRESGPQPSVLQEVTIPIWGNAECRQKYGYAAPGGIVDHMLCAGQASRDSCSGDSGGPLMVNEGRWTQVGIVSWGIGCGKGQYPGVYSRVSHFIPWITKNTKS